MDALEVRPCRAVVFGVREQDVVRAQASARIVLATRIQVAGVVDRDRRITRERAALPCVAAKKFAPQVRPPSFEIE